MYDTEPRPWPNPKTGMAAHPLFFIKWVLEGGTAPHHAISTLMATKKIYIVVCVLCRKRFVSFVLLFQKNKKCLPTEMAFLFPLPPAPVVRNDCPDASHCEIRFRSGRRASPADTSLEEKRVCFFGVVRRLPTLGTGARAGPAGGHSNQGQGAVRWVCTVNGRAEARRGEKLKKFRES